MCSACQADVRTNEDLVCDEGAKVPEQVGLLVMHWTTTTSTTADKKQLQHYKKIKYIP